MADIFISYSQNDRNRVAPLFEALSAEGYEVWWDLNIRSGESFDRTIERILPQARCVIAVWSRKSVGSDWVRAESAWAKDREKLVSIRIDEDLELPLKFYHVHTKSMVGWDGDSEARVFRDLVADICSISGSLPSRAQSKTKPEPAAPDIASPLPTAEHLSTFRDPLRDGGEGPGMVVIPAGRFWMGSPEGEPGRYEDEGPRHPVEIPRPFALGRTPITFAEYDRFAKATRRNKPEHEGWGRGSRPVIKVNWNDAVAYAKWLSQQTGKRYRLPTEAEWEYAARAGTETRWSFGDIQGELHRCAWHLKNSNAKTHPVGEKEPNNWRLYDMHGNVWEWVEDCWHESYEEAPADGSAWLEADGGKCYRRVIRGGSWQGIPRYARSAQRNWNDADDAGFDLGFRLVRNP